MSKIKLLIIIYCIIPISTIAQWEEKNISTSSTLSSVDFLDDNIGFVTGRNTIYKTVDGGESWIVSYTAGSLVSYDDIFVIDNQSVIAVGLDFDTDKTIITKSENAGTNWTEIVVPNSIFLKSVFFVNANIGYCAGSDGTILKSTDSGNSWQELNSGTNLSLQSIFFFNDLIGLVVGGGPGNAIILKTEDGGLNWNFVNSFSEEFLQSIFLISQETGYVVGWNGEIMKTTDCGNSWQYQNSVTMTGNLEVIFTDQNTGYIVGGSQNESLIQKTVNSGDEWEDVSPQISQGLVGINFPSFNIGYAVGSNGTVVKTKSGGVTSTTSNLDGINKFMVYPNPTNNFVHIQSIENTKIETIILYDSNGRALQEFNFNSEFGKIDLSHLDSNVYYLELRSNKQKVLRKILKK